MNQSIFYSNNNDDICEAVGCFAEATTKVNVKVGLRGIITLYLCVNCIDKFDQREKVLEQVEHPASNTNYSTPPVSIQGVRSRQ